MIAKSYYGWNSDFTNVIKADEYIKSVIPNAEYMDITKDNAVAFVSKTKYTKNKDKNYPFLYDKYCNFDVKMI